MPCPARNTVPSIMRYARPTRPENSFQCRHLAGGEKPNQNALYDRDVGGSERETRKEELIEFAFQRRGSLGTLEAAIALEVIRGNTLGTPRR
jgi:hypothetical protein